MANRKQGKQRQGSRSSQPKCDRDDTRRDDQRERQRRSRRDAEEQSKPTARTYGLNDVSWYAKYPDLLSVVSRIPFPNKPGMEFMLPTIDGNPAAGTTGTQGADQQQYIPGVMVMSWMPSVGRAKLVTDPINIAAKEVYAQVRSKFSGALDADAPDFMVYIMALDSIFAYIGSLKRIYRILNAYSPYNYVLPDVLLGALGANNSTVIALRSALEQGRSYINQLVKMTKKFAMPDIMDIFRRHYWMNDNVYTDAPTANSQFYAFAQSGYFSWSLLDVVNPDGSAVSPAVKAGGLEMLDAPLQPGIAAKDETVTWDELYTFGLNLISNLATSDDAYTISGYLMRAYEGAPQFVAEELLPAEELTPVYVPEVLAQIENSHSILRNNAAFTANVMRVNVQQCVTTNTLYHVPVVNNNQLLIQQRLCDLSVRSDAPTVDEVVIATRLKNAIGDSVAISTAVNGHEVVCGTEIVIGWSVCFGADAAARYTALGYGDSAIYVNATFSAKASTSRDALRAIAYASQFDWNPLVRVYIPGYSPDAVKSASMLFGDVHNYTQLAASDLAQIHRICVFSEFNAFSV